MVITREKKSEIIKDLEGRIKKSNLIVFLNFHGLKVKDTQGLRRKLKKEKIEYRVAKKTLIGLALKNSAIDSANLNMEGEIGVSLAQTEEISVLPKILAGFKKEYPGIKILGGFFEKQYLDGKRIEEISKLPPRKMIYANFIGQLNAPIGGFISVLNGPLNNFGRIIYQMSQKKQ